MFAPVLICLLVLLALGGAERIARDRAWRSVPIRIHVNGTRGKSTVTRLIWSALREAGIPAVARTTGTATRVLLPDGTERPFRRRGAASIREQLAVLRLARRAGARAVVLECMALDPGLQHVSERDMVHATIGVITNVRLDHTDVMGRDLESIAATLANTIPAGGIVVTGERHFGSLFERRATQVAAKVVAAEPAARPCGNERGTVPFIDPSGWLAESTAIALAVARQLGIPDETSLRGFSVAPPDPGAARTGRLVLSPGTAQWLNATAANDPESLARLVDQLAGRLELAGAGQKPRRRIVVYNNRPDRAARLACFAERSTILAEADQLIITGAPPPVSVWRRLRRMRRHRPLSFVPPRRMAAWLEAHAAAAAVVFCGNVHGLDVPHLLEGVGHD